MEIRLSTKIKNCSLLLMIMVVFLHSYNVDIKHGGTVLVFEKGINWFIQNFISNGLTRIAVPLFFIVSGYLFISKATFDVQDYKIKVSKRISTLVIPYLFWTFFGLLFYFILQSIPQSQGFFTKKLIRDYSFLEWINAIFIEPIPYQLWFLRDLIVMVFLSPIIYFLVKQVKFIFLFVVLAFWFLSQDSVFLTSEGLLFFSLGIYIRNFKNEIVTRKSKNVAIFVTVWILLLILKTTIGYNDFSEIAEKAFLKVSILIGIVAFWMLLDSSIYLHYLEPQVSKIVSYSFFIYAFHEPFLTIVKKGLFSLLSKTPTNYLLVYFVAPVIILIVSIFTAMFLKRWTPFVYKFITGNR